MAPIELEQPKSYLPVFLLSAYVLTVIYSSVDVVRTIYASYVRLPPSAATRYRQPLRKSHVRIFLFLSVASLVAACYFAVSIWSLSYKTWAGERGIELPSSLFGDQGALRGGTHPGRLEIVRWLNDVYLNIDHLMFAAARHPWWNQQAGLSLVAWSIFLSIEGRRRRIPNLFAFMLIAQQIGLSYAQNLFFVAILLTPVPLLGDSSVKFSIEWMFSRFFQFMQRWVPWPSTSWSPFVPVFFVVVLAESLAVYLALETSLGALLNFRLLSRATLFLPLLVPLGPPAPRCLFPMVSIVSFLLYAKSSFSSLLFAPIRGHSYSVFESQRKYMSLQESGEKLFGALSEHPVVGAVGWDVLLSALSMGIWASIRRLDVEKMATSSIFFVRSEEDFGPDEKHRRIAHQGDVKNRPKPKPFEFVSSVDEAMKSEPPAPRRSTRGRKTSASQAAKSSTPSDTDAYVPDASSEVMKSLVQGDELDGTEEVWDAAALAWGLIIVAGLGVGSAAVFGGEVLSSI